MALWMVKDTRCILSSWMALEVTVCSRTRDRGQFAPFNNAAAEDDTRRDMFKRSYGSDNVSVSSVLFVSSGWRLCASPDMR